MIVHLSLSLTRSLSLSGQYVRACVRARARMYVCVCRNVCVHVCVCVCVCACARARARAGVWPAAARVGTTPSGPVQLGQPMMKMKKGHITDTKVEMPQAYSEHMLSRRVIQESK